MSAFDATFRKSKVPAGIAEFPHSIAKVNDQGQVYLGKLLVDVKIVASTGEARRLIDGGGVKINGETVAPRRYNVEPSLLSKGHAAPALYAVLADKGYFPEEELWLSDVACCQLQLLLRRECGGQVSGGLEHEPDMLAPDLGQICVP